MDFLLFFLLFSKKRAHQERAVLQETMTFGKNFNQKLDNVQLPENLQLLRPLARDGDTRRMNGKIAHEDVGKVKIMLQFTCNSFIETKSLF